MRQADTLPGPEVVLDRYRLVRRLGTGGFGTVWLAEDERLRRAVAVKRIPLSDGDPERAQREAQAAARLSHPGIVALYEAGADDDACYLVSELVRGQTLAALLAEGALSDRDVVRIGAALCEALEHAHARGVIHRDVKPGNVMVPEVPERGGPPAKLTDFGIARVVGGEALTRTGDVVGTLAYMAPEQAEGRRLTPACDVYALGLVVYEGLTGTNPVRGAGPGDTARRVGRPLPPLRRVRRDLPRALCEAVDAAVLPAPEDRPAPAELRAALTAAVETVDDEPGVVAGGVIEELTSRWETVERTYAEPPRTRWGRRRDADASDAARGTRRWGRDEGAAGGTRRWDREADVGDGWAPEDDAARPGAPRVPFARTVARRAGAAVAAGALAAAVVAGLAPAGAVEPLTAAIVVAGAVALLPRLAWIAAAAGAVAWLAAEGRPGYALVALAGFVLVPPLLLFGPAGWSLPAAAPALGAIGLGPAYPVLAGQARTPLRRAALGALGAVWSLLAEALAGHRLLAGPAAGTGPPAAWRDSAGGALDHALHPLVSTPLLSIAAVWAVAAVILPWLVRGRSAAADLGAAIIWAAGVAAGTAAAANAAGAPAHGLAAGAALAALVAVAARAARRPPGPRPDRTSSRYPADDRA